MVKNKINDKNYVIQNNYNHINLFYCNQIHLNFKLNERNTQKHNT